ncbi:hypothetical protein SDC9_125712 [bioreactor metagenome]|uniref:Uncharacterized protein n=1 Tax=bioreactor metagenome TaxID=1076179 RepID=A0A645CP58_9ZZZZ
MISSSTDLSHHRTYGSRIRRFNNLSISNARTDGLNLLAPIVRAFCSEEPDARFHSVKYANSLFGLRPI